MRLTVEQLGAALKKTLAPIYFITGDEPLQQGEAADAIRAVARNAGFNSRDIVTVDAQFEWAAINAAAESLSIFADKKIIDCRLPSGKPGTEGSKALLYFCRHIPDDTILLVTSGKLESASLKSKWFQALDRHGVVVQVWPLTGTALLRWLQMRLQLKGMTATPEGIKILAARLEGNLLAAAQEIEKLYILYGAGHLDEEAIASVVADSSRYDVFALADCLLVGNIGRTVKVLQGLKTEGVAAPVVLWAITREARLLTKIKSALQQGQTKAAAFQQHQVWEKRKALVNSAVDRLEMQQLDRVILMSALADRQIKGQRQGSPWETLQKICLIMAGADVMAAA
ncbi:MAG: DNA polymerase III subunit delta [Gammaproteobacteria bacterium HGW-Gammaproteobacteria-3]|nr:MAG: DNA polymerase III subunit delta [Gammaproteobacteria bacterium HGW-Gammaproteobacteria-3]